MRGNLKLFALPSDFDFLRDLQSLINRVKKYGGKQMKENRIYNFNAGPAALPIEVLEEIKDSFLNFGGSGMSITEISHQLRRFRHVDNRNKPPFQVV